MFTSKLGSLATRQNTLILTEFSDSHAKEVESTDGMQKLAQICWRFLPSLVDGMVFIHLRISRNIFL